jgi:protein-S-isoprenylcysteine O-methyltransferase Ste14
MAIACIDLMLFGIAGRLDWPAPWLLTLTFLVPYSIGAPWLVRHDPDLLQERMSRAAGNVPRWDRILLRIYLVLFLALLMTAALDAGRFQRSNMPVAVQAMGTVCVLVAIAVIWWCVAVNPFLASYARIQDNRGHKVVRDGPYQYVRHPMYTAVIMLMIGIALFLGSWLAMMPAILIGIVFVVRTGLEDRLLKLELDGYRAYAEHVPSRLLPGVW